MCVAILWMTVIGVEYTKNIENFKKYEGIFIKHELKGKKMSKVYKIL